MKATATATAHSPEGLHVGIIMDGNGRWATRQGRSRSAGHRQGAQVVRRIVEVAPDYGVGTLTLYAFSADNWRRPEREVSWLMRLFREYLRIEAMRCAAQGVRLIIVGRRDRLPRGLVSTIEDAEARTAHCHRLHLRIAIDYSARDAILRAAQCVAADDTVPSRESFARLLSIVDHGGPFAAPVDLLIRTGGERRLSDFLLWECAYAELCFMPIMWPEFGPQHLEQAVADFRRRERRFGALPDAAAAS
ncbi:MAG TPA: di-trans,poly-cis-decaprenylcistransferase [Gemmatimonadales bacterium]|nr:di-trans,poly-cis-decaprenylcistransferase [Gemmatimonadales bacterium]